MIKLTSYFFFILRHINVWPYYPVLLVCDEHVLWIFDAVQGNEDKNNCDFSHHVLVSCEHTGGHDLS